MTVVVEGETRNRKRARQGVREGAMDYRYAEKISTPSTFFSFFFAVFFAATRWLILMKRACSSITIVPWGKKCSILPSSYSASPCRASRPTAPVAVIVPFPPSLVLLRPARIDQRRQTFPANLRVSPIPLKGERFKGPKVEAFDEKKKKTQVRGRRLLNT